MKLLTFLSNQPDNVLTRALADGKKPFAVAAVFSFFSNILYLAMPLYTYQVYGRIMMSQSQATLWLLSFITIFVFAISSVIDDYRARILINYGVVLDQRVSGRLFSGLFDAAVRGGGSGSSQVLRDLDTFRQTLTGIAAAAFFDLPWIPVFVFVLFLIDPWVGVLTLVGAAVLLGLALSQERSIRPPMKESNDAAMRSYAFTEAATRNSEVVRAMGMLPTLGAAWAHFRRITIERGAVTSEMSNAYTDTIKATRMAIQILIIAIGAWLIMRGKLQSGMLFANMILASRALSPIEKIVSAWEPLNKMVAAHQRVMETLQRAEPPGPVTTLPRPRGRLTVEGLNFAPANANRLILNNLNFAVEPGETLGIVGPSGAGKSTLARLLVGVWRPINGVVRLDGADVFTWDRADFGRHIGYLPQDTELFAGTIRQNIARFRTDVTDEQVIRAAQLAGVHELVLRTPKGYDTQVGEGGVVLSAGQRQRVGLARAMLGDPAYIVLDEPNASLDSDGEQALLEAVEAMKANGATIIIISHKIGIFRAADKIMAMRDGRLELFGPRDAVLARLMKPTEVRAVEAG